MISPAAGCRSSGNLRVIARQRTKPPFAQPAAASANRRYGNVDFGSTGSATMTTFSAIAITSITTQSSTGMPRRRQHGRIRPSRDSSNAAFIRRIGARRSATTRHPHDQTRPEKRPRRSGTLCPTKPSISALGVLWRPGASASLQSARSRGRGGRCARSAFRLARPGRRSPGWPKRAGRWPSPSRR